MVMALNGIAKYVEELGESLQALGKFLAFPEGPHPDGKGEMRSRVEDEFGDVAAAMDLVIETHAFDRERIAARASEKLALFRHWHYHADARIGVRLPLPGEMDGKVEFIPSQEIEAAPAEDPQGASGTEKPEGEAGIRP